MAYSLYEEAQQNGPDPIQYYPEEYDYPSFYHKLAEVKPNPRHPPPPSTKKPKRPSTTVNYVNEKKCPIYIHQYKVQNPSTFNNYSGKTIPKAPAEKKPQQKTKKFPGYPTTKSVLDQLEETYWATWKPNKEKENVVMPKKNRLQNEKVNKVKDYGDVPDCIPSYFTSSEYESCTATAVEDSDYEKYSKNYETVINMEDSCEDSRNPTNKLKVTHTQEIQTDLILPKIEERTENEDTTKKVIEKKDEQIEKTERESEENEKPSEKSSDEDTAPETRDEEKSKLLRHTDSFIINKKKQSEVKERFQQPKCIRLYRKPGLTSSSFIRGGTYPLKSCLKREPVPKGNFRLGPPGSPLFVSNSSIHKKSKK